MLRRWKKFYNEWNEVFREDLEYTANFIYYQAMTVNIIYLFGLFLETIGNPFILVLLEILLFISSIVYLICVICKYYI